jgi:flagellar hook-associated protein 2
MAGTSSVSSSTASISGLVSGLDTGSIISQLMQIESQPQALLQQKMTAVAQDAVAYRDVNTSFAALQSAAAKLTDPATWSAMKATTNSSSVTATANAGAAGGSLTFTVNQLAQAHSVISGTSWGATTATMPTGSSLTITQGSTTTTISTDGMKLSDVVDAINKKGLGLTAQAVKTGNAPDKYQLQVTANSTGQAGTFGLTFGTANDFSVVTPGQDADITVGAAGYGYHATSSTNTFTDVLPGTSFTVSQAATTATVTASSDTQGITDAVSALADAANAVIKKISGYTDSSQSSTAPLKGDWAMISLSQNILSAVSSAVGTGSAGLNGLQTQKDGTISFDAAKFKAALVANPSLVQGIFGGTNGVGPDNVKDTPDDTIDVDGVAARLLQLSNQASDSATGSLTLLANGEDAVAKDLQSQIDNWTTRLTNRQQQLTDQFNAMESALGTLQSQSNWLTAQINSLPGFSSSSTKKS